MGRDRLPNRRGLTAFDFTVGQVHYVASAGFFDDDLARPAEIFLDGGKPGSAVAVAARDAAVVLSIALQHGVPAESIRAALTRANDGTASGPVGVVLDRLAADAEAAV